MHISYMLGFAKGFMNKTLGKYLNRLQKEVILACVEDWL